MDTKAPDLAEQLTKLSKLHADGVLTDEDFTALKNKLIGKSSDFQAEQEPHSRPARTKKESNDFQEQARLAQTQLQKRLKDNPSLAWGGGAMIVCVLGYILFFSSGDKPDCASSAATSLVAQIAKDNNNALFIAYVYSISLTLEIKKIKVTNDWFQRFKDEATYTIANVRMSSRDTVTKAVKCQADIIVEVPPVKQFDVGQYSNKIPITYKVENTSEGKLYATVYGLK